MQRLNTPRPSIIFVGRIDDLNSDKSIIPLIKELSEKSRENEVYPCFIKLKSDGSGEWQIFCPLDAGIMTTQSREVQL
jgi:hypothetical protein